jgi:non-specific serine/threonine protein kinase
MPTPRGGLGAAGLDGALYVLGGETPGVFPHVEAFHPASNSWFRAEDMPTPRHGIAVVAAGGRIFVIGGGSVEGLGPSTANEAFTP